MDGVFRERSFNFMASEQIGEKPRADNSPAEFFLVEFAEEFEAVDACVGTLFVLEESRLHERHGLLQVLIFVTRGAG